jgi:hypothetical protein
MPAGPRLPDSVLASPDFPLGYLSRSISGIRPLVNWPLRTIVVARTGFFMKRQKAFSLLQLLIEMSITLLIAGVILPSLVRSDLATSEALAAGSLHTINIAGIAFSYTNQNVGFAILGAFIGTMAVFAVHFHAGTAKNTTSTRTITLRPGALRH